MLYVATLLSILLQPQFAGTAKNIILSLLFVSGFSNVAIFSGAVGSWSVADEAIFYMCLPFLFWRIKSLKTALIWLVAGWVVGFSMSVFLSTVYPSQAEFFQFASFSVEFPIFLMGIAGFFIWKELIIGTEEKTRKYVSLLLLGATGILYWALLPFSYISLYSSSIVCLMLLVTLSLHPWPLFVNRLTRFMGKISYSVYLLHFYVFLRIHPKLAGFKPAAELWLCFFGTLLITVPAAYLTWRWIEEPGIRLGRSIIAKLEGREIRGTSLVPPALAVVGEGNSPDSQF